MKNIRYIGILAVALLMAVVILPQIAMAQGNTTSQQCYDVDFSGLPAGTILSNQIAGMTITTHDPVNHPPMIFDSSNPTGGDLDLGTPNVDFGGPGRGKGGRLGADGENSVALGNIIIISEDGDTSDPDDNASGGQIIITFDNPVNVDYMYFLDIDEGPATAALYDASGTQIHMAPVGPASYGNGKGDNGVYRVDLDTEGVSKIVATLPGSGSIASVFYCDEPEATPEPTETPTEPTETPTEPTETPTEPTPTEPTPTPTEPPPAVCAIDLVVVLDESDGLDDTQFQAEKNFVLNLISVLNLGPGSANLGVAYFSTFGGITVGLSGDPVVLTDAINADTREGGFSDIAAGIDTAQAELANNGRAGVQNIMIVISDGEQFDLFGNDPVVSAENARAAGTILYGIGVPDEQLGTPPNTVVMQAIANDPDSEHYTEVTFSGIDDLSFVTSIATNVCPEPENRPPVAVDDNYVTDQDVPLTVPLPGVLSNDSDPDGDALFIEASDLVTTQGGTVTAIAADGSFTYTPPAGFTGVDTFTYQLNDGELLSNVATVTITIRPVVTETPTPTETQTPTETPTPTEEPTQPTQTPEVTPPPVCVSGIARLELWNADTDQIIMILGEGDVIDRSAFGNARVTIVAVTEPSSVGSVQFLLSGAENRNDVENIVPYSMHGDNNGNLQGARLRVGNYTLTVKAFEKSNLRGILCDQETIHFSVIKHQPTQEPTQPPATEEPTQPPYNCHIQWVKIWNADSDERQLVLQNGAVLDLAVINNANVTIRVYTQPTHVGSVAFNLVGPLNYSDVENVEPYTIFGDDGNGDFYGQHLPVGNYTINAKAYTLPYAEGVVCAESTINFSVIDSRPQPTEEPTTPPTQDPTEEPTQDPTQEPTQDPTQDPTQEPTQDPNPTEEPTPDPTEEPTQEPTPDPTEEPTQPAPTCNLVHFKIWDARRGFQTYLENGQVFDLAVLRDVDATFLIWTEPSPVGSVNIDITGAITNNRTENIVPYTAFGGNGWNGMVERTLVPGNYTIKATAYTEANGGGQVCGERTVSFTLINSSQ